MKNIMTLRRRNQMILNRLFWTMEDFRSAGSPVPKALLRAYEKEKYNHQLLSGYLYAGSNTETACDTIREYHFQRPDRNAALFMLAMHFDDFTRYEYIVFDRMAIPLSFRHEMYNNNPDITIRPVEC